MNHVTPSLRNTLKNTPATTAKEWNLAAQENNRVTVILQPASKDSIVNSNQRFF